ncbi:uncharacterized protein TRAVEDRAFT_165536 [Trametes versicolor FP-101664 SS1]|uniref:uncharacterized protein n=1 Tax=Trametes versicolor (strain FP-101664) TaxID=717944 RepID=UPI0004622E0C|nr:uncharacterized protein TRAVEDRAFT_165536 [Trametes versicolor FP-101664 SS1]EIW60613.1 hypothetical protein TRAVEDRAFT_165536 [Trametes versicolor FP-101664 SS1]
MASTLTLSALPSDAFLSSLDGPPPSQDFKMHQVPDVFVIPPEEEQEDNPPWCVFDAAAAAAHGLSTIPDIDTLDVALGLHQQMDNRSPSFTRLHSNASQETIIMPHRGAGTLPRLHDIDLDMEDGQTDIRSRGNGSTRNRTYDDEEIVEVVKVRRSEGMADVGDRTLKLKKSSTFRARATQALRSIKNVGKGSRRATVSEPKPLMKLAPHAADTVPSRHSYQEETPVSPARATSPTMSRRRSMTLSQMFAFKENSKENRSASRPASPLADEPLSPTSPSYDSPVATQPMSPTDVTGSHAKRLQPSPSLEDCMATPTRSLSPGGDDDGSKPTLSKRKSFRRRLSVLELQKLFTKASGSSNPQPDLQASAPSPTPPDVDEDLFSPSLSRPLSMDSTAMLSSSSSRKSSVSFGDTPQMSSRPSYTSQRTVSGSSGVADVISDEDLEMRLDSLHFDSLHFDPDEIMSTI